MSDTESIMSTPDVESELNINLISSAGGTPTAQDLSEQLTYHDRSSLHEFTVYIVSR